MASAITASSIDAALKVYYGGQKLEKIVFGNEDRVFLNAVKKDTNYAGRNYPMPVYWGDAAGGRSATFSNALANASSVKIDEFVLTTAEDNQIVTISTKALKAARNDKGSFLTTQTMRVDTALNHLSNSLEQSLFGNGDGVLGQRASISTNTITLATARDGKNFEVGQVLVAAATKTGALRTGSSAVTHVNVGATTSTVTIASAAAITAFEDNDYLFVQGDAANTGAVKKLRGLEAWCATPVVAESFFGVDRSVHPTRLGVLNHAGASADVKKALTDAAAFAKDHHSAKPRKAFMSWTVWGDLVDQLEADVLRAPGSSTSAGYQYVQVYGPAGPIECCGSPYCPSDTIYLLDMDSWCLVSLGPPVRINDDDGRMVSRQTSDRGVEVRADSDVQLGCNAPGKNIKIALS